MGQVNETSTPAGDERFTWHPTYQGKTLQQVREDVRIELQRDQRAYGLTMEGAEEHEQAVLASVIDLEKKWSEYDFGWAEADPAALADRIAAFEWEREQRRELFPFAEVRTAGSPASSSSATSARPWWAFWRR